MYEITGSDIASLRDDDLRTLIGLLCEAEVRRRHFSASAVIYGGSQTAKDGGLDVRVVLREGDTISGFVPKADTAYQVKKPKMPPSAIEDEMKPNGILRPIFEELARVSGAYVIVSSTDSTSESGLRNRRKKMAAIVQDIPNSTELTLDFFDQHRVATWVRDHVGLVPWVRSRIGRSIRGWHSYGNWSHAPEGTDTTYLLDNAVRIRTGHSNEGNGLSTADGIDRIRDVLRVPRGVVRLVGVSGVGKTRLVEALFDSTVGLNALESSIAIYTNVGEGADPQPAGLAYDLIGNRTRAILVIDNCTPEAHRQLSEIVRSAGSTVSVITVEYDIREDQPEGTDVFLLDTSSVELVQKLVARRFAVLSQVDIRSIAEFSGGNTRVALALAGTVHKSETISGLTDEELFRRLFQQRHDPDVGLLSVAQVCSLVYSFDGETMAGNEAELHVLGGLIGRSVDEMYAAIAELKRRDLLQIRGRWRAILPHAIANRLAALALQNIPKARLMCAFTQAGCSRLLRSFSRRLGYLDSSKEARSIVEDWLRPGGLVGDVTNLTELGRAILENIAPVSPEALLSILEATLVQVDEVTLNRNTRFIRLLRSIAYDSQHFERVVPLLIRFAKLPGDDESGRAGNTLVSLFHIILSGTHAPLDLRVKVVGRMLSSVDGVERALGCRALQALLKAGQFSSSHNFEFGARSRDYGYYPRASKELDDWYATVLDFAKSIALSPGPAAQCAHDAIAQGLRDLWKRKAIVDQLESLVRDMASRGFWREGWIAIRQFRKHSGSSLSPIHLAKLVELEELLAPKNLADKVRALVFVRAGGILDIAELDEVENGDYAAAAARAAATVENLGRELANDVETLRVLLPETAHVGYRALDFGRGMALAADKPRDIWSALIKQGAKTDALSLGLLGGFLDGVQRRNPTLADALLDEALDDSVLGKWSPVLQASVAIDGRGIERLHHALNLGRAPIKQFESVMYGKACDGIPGTEFERLLIAIAGKPGGLPVAMSILSTRLYSDRTAKRQPDSKVVDTGRTLLASYQFSQQGQDQALEAHQLGPIVRVSLAGPDEKATAKALSHRLMLATMRYEVYGFHYDELLQALLEVHPAAVLDELLSKDPESQVNGIALLRDHHTESPMAVVPDETLLRWCNGGPKTRYAVAAAVVPLFQESEESPTGWTPIIHQLLSRAPNAGAVFDQVIARIEPTSWSGSFATILENRLKLLDQLNIAAVPGLAALLNDAKVKLAKEVERQRRQETEEDEARSGRFE